MEEDNETSSPVNQVQVFPDEKEWPWSLSEDDVPGASLGGNDPGSVNLSQLKFWLKCRGISATNMSKSQAVNVVQKTIENVDLMNQPILDPKYPYYTDKKIQKLRQNGHLSEELLAIFPSLRPPMFPPVSDIWVSVDNMSQETIKYLKMFSNKTILDYFTVMSCQRDTNIHNRALMRGSQLHTAGHVQDFVTCLHDPVQHALIDRGLFLKASVQASMKNARYETKLTIYQYEPQSIRLKIRYAECTCVAGKAGVCGHIAATLNKLASACSQVKPETECQPETPCTSMLNAWKGRAATLKRKQQIAKMPLENYEFNKITVIGEKQKKSRAFDPDSFNPALSQTNETIHEKMHSFVSHFSADNSCSFRALSLWKFKYLK